MRPRIVIATPLQPELASEIGAELADYQVCYEPELLPPGGRPGRVASTRGWSNALRAAGLELTRLRAARGQLVSRASGMVFNGWWL